MILKTILKDDDGRNQLLGSWIRADADRPIGAAAKGGRQKGKSRQ